MYYWLTENHRFVSMHRAASAILTSSNIESSIPLLYGLKNDKLFNNVLSGILTGLAWTFFFSVCPYLFKMIANFGSGATSVRYAEYRAIQYYWWFILITAFTGTSLSNMILNGINAGTLAESLPIMKP